MEQVEANQAAMKEEKDEMQGKMARLLEAMMFMARKEDNPRITVDARNIASQLGSSPLHIRKVNNPEFRLPQGYTPPEGVAVPPPVRIPLVNLASHYHYVASVRHGSMCDEEDP